MEAWGWLLAYVVGFGLLQLFLFRYFGRDDPSPDATPGGGDVAAPFSGRAGGSDEPEGVHCPHCGTYNAHESTFAYCKECVELLG